jgi:hypoxanthine phosphoribosyltransferase
MMNIHYNTILGVKRGGVIPAALLHRHFPKSYLAMCDDEDFISLLYGNVLVVDDIWDTGKTLKRLQIRADDSNAIHTVSLVSRVEFVPTWHTYSGFINGPEWVVFPWEVHDGNS